TLQPPLDRYLLLASYQHVRVLENRVPQPRGILLRAVDARQQDVVGPVDRDRCGHDECVPVLFVRQLWLRFWPELGRGRQSRSEEQGQKSQPRHGASSKGVRDTRASVR